MSGMSLLLAGGGLALVVGLIALVAKLARSAGRAEAVKGIADETNAAAERVAEVTAKPHTRKSTAKRLRDGSF